MKLKVTKVIVVINKIMKNFFLIITILITTINQSTASDLKDFEIEGVSIGESLLKYGSLKEIQSIKSRIKYKSDKFITYRFEKIHTLNKYDRMNVSVKKGDKKFIIQGMSGILYYDSLDECNSYKKQIQSIVEKEFIINAKDITEFPSNVDSTGKSIIYGIQNYLKPYPRLESITINCFNFTKESKLNSNLKVGVNTHEFFDFVINN